MKALLAVFVLAIAATATATSAQAQNYPWCAIYSTGEGAGVNCGFTSYQQCQADVSGIGGYCERNNTYVPPPGPTAPTRRRHPQP